MLSLVPRVLVTAGKLTIVSGWILMLLTVFAVQEDLSDAFKY